MSGAAESVMKIGNNADLASTLSHTAAAKQQAKVAATPAPAAETAARSAAKAGNAGVPVTLSENVLTAALGRSATDFNAEKVAAVKSAIEKGSFRVNAEAVADKMLENAAETLSYAQARRSH